jgi:hypothetical protein
MKELLKNKHVKNKPDHTTELVKDAILITIDGIKNKIKDCDSPRDISLYVASIKTLTESYKALIS